MKLSNDINTIQSTIAENEMVLAYFTSTDCNMCKDLFPKIEKMLEAFPKVVGIRGEVDQELKIVGAYNVLTVPTVILFVQGKETIRKSRQISINDFAASLDRYYQMLF